jgi:hypothetical protein
MKFRLDSAYRISNSFGTRKKSLAIGWLGSHAVRAHSIAHWSEGRILKTLFAMFRSALSRVRRETPRRRFHVEPLGSRELLANHAPTLLPNRTPVLNSIQEGALIPQSTQVIGTPVTSLAEKSTVLGGKLQNVIDPDLNAKIGIVVTKTDNTHGTWYFSTDTGTTWKAFSNLATGKGLLLSETALVYFKPSFGFSGTVSTAITFRAWDQTLGRSGSIALLSTVGGSTSYSQQTDTAAIVVRPLPVVTPAVRQAVDHMLDLIRNCQNPDGSFNQTDYRAFANSDVWIAPYFANYAALGLLAGNDRVPNSADMLRVGRWLDWCASHQEDGGYWYDYRGTISSYSSTGFVDAKDASAALFLMVTGRYCQAGGAITLPVLTAAQKSLAGIEKLRDIDGLTWASDTYSTKYLEDNLEVQTGLRDAAYLFRAKGLTSEAARATQYASQISQKLLGYFQTSADLFAYSLDSAGYQIGSGLYPRAQAQLISLAYVMPKVSVWNGINSSFQPDDSNPLASAGSERWLVASQRFGSQEVSRWRTATIVAANSFTTTNVYSFRCGLVVGAFLKGTTFMGG